MDEIIIKYWLKIFIFGVLFFALIRLFMDTMGIDLNVTDRPKKLMKVITMEAFLGIDAFCKKYQGNSGQLNTACGHLTNKNCSKSGCCILTSGQKCVAGNADGPTYNTDNIDYYYYQNKCYGEKCMDRG
jgi:hypothetical protein